MTGVRGALPLRPMCVRRDNELKSVRVLRDRATASGRPLLVAVSGGSGVGKSTLILTIAHELGELYHEVLYCALRPSDPYSMPTPADVLADLLVQLGVSWEQLPEPSLRLSVLRSVIAGRRMLLVLDDVESAGQVLPLLGDLREAGVIVAGERHLEHLRTAGFEPIKLLGFPPPDGVHYLTTIAGSVVADVDPAVLHRLATLCGGVPWILRAAAVRLSDGDEPAADYVRRLEEAATQDEMSEDLRMDDTSVFDAVCEESYRGLTSEEARAYRWLSLTPGPDFDLEQSAALLELPMPRAKRLIRELVDRSLVRALGADRFEFPQVMRKHAVKKAHDEDSAPNPDDLAARADRWCAKQAVALANTITERPIAPAAPGSLFRGTASRYRGERAVEQAYDEFAAHWPTFVAAARRAVRLGNAVDAVVLPMAMWPFGYHTFRVGELIDAYRVLAEIADHPTMAWSVLDDDATRWQLWRDCGTLHERIGELDEAGGCFRRAAAVDYPPGRASSLEWQAIVLGDQGRFEEALDLLPQAWAAVPLLADSAQEQRSDILLRMHRGRFLIALGRGPEAEPDIVAALAYFDSRPTDVQNAARSRALLGDIAEQGGSATEARARWTQALAEFTRYGLRAEAAKTHDKLADLAESAGNSTDAQMHREQARQLRPEP